MAMKTFSCAEMDHGDLYRLLSSVVAPRPICLASTMDELGRVNLSPFSFFNMVSTSPPVCIFSPLLSARGGWEKHTLHNVKQVAECVINLVDYSMVQQVSLASSEFARGVNEFEKAGFTMLASETVSPPRVAEARVQMECVVDRVISLGIEKGAGNLVIAQIKRIHLDQDVFGPDGEIDPLRLDLVARLGGDWYARTVPQGLFKLKKPISKIGIGVDALPADVVSLGLLSGNELGVLASEGNLPMRQQLTDFYSQQEVKKIYMDSGADLGMRKRMLVELAKDYLAKDCRGLALMAVMLAGNQEKVVEL